MERATSGTRLLCTLFPQHLRDPPRQLQTQKQQTLARRKNPSREKKMMHRILRMSNTSSTQTSHRLARFITRRPQQRSMSSSASSIPDVVPVPVHSDNYSYLIIDRANVCNAMPRRFLFHVSTQETNKSIGHCGRCGSSRTSKSDCCSRTRKSTHHPRSHNTQGSNENVYQQKNSIRI